MMLDAREAQSILRDSLDIPDGDLLAPMVRMLVDQRNAASGELIRLRYKVEGRLPDCVAETLGGNRCSRQGSANYLVSKTGEYSKREVLCGIHSTARQKSGWAISRIDWGLDV